MTTVRFIRAFRGTLPGQQLTVDDAVAASWIDAGLAVVTHEEVKALDAPVLDKAIRSPARRKTKGDTHGDHSPPSGGLCRHEVQATC